MMFSPPSSPSVLASTSRHNIIQPQQHNEQRHQKSLRLFLGHQSDEDLDADCDYDCHYGAQCDSDSDSDDSVLGRASGSSSRQSLQPGRIATTRVTLSNDPRTVRAVASNCAYDNEEQDGAGLFSSRRQAKRPRTSANPKKASVFASTTSAKQQAAASAAIPTTPTKRQKGFLVRGNVTPSRAFSIFKAAKQRSQQRQQHGLMTPPTSSPLRPIILDSFDEDLANGIQTSPSECRSRPTPFTSSSSKRHHIHSQSPRKRSLHTPTSTRFNLTKPASAFAGGVNNHPSLPQAFHSLRIRQHIPYHGRHGISRISSAAYTTAIDTSSFLETFVSPASCFTQLPRSSDDDYLSHPICAAYSYSSRAVNPSAQWLAVGDDEGRVTLLNTLAWQDSTADQPAENPQWQASNSSSVFEVVWRFDDRSILTGCTNFGIRSWDTEYQQCTASFAGHVGSPRTIVYDPTTNGDGGCGMIFASAGRDGTVRLWDARVTSSGGGGEGGDLIKPVLTIYAAHGNAPAGPKGRSTAVGGRGRKRSQQPRPPSVPALSYLPDGQGHKLLTGGAENGIIKCWDLRHVRDSKPSSAVSEVDPMTVSAAWGTSDLSLLHHSSSNHPLQARAHGITQILPSSTSLYVSCTGGKIYALPLSTFLDSKLTPSEVQTLYDPIQRQNTLFTRMSLFDDRFLAVGCNTGKIALWDVTTSHDRLASIEPDRDLEEERKLAAEMEMGFGSRSKKHAGMAVLEGGHEKNKEVSAVTWANGPNGPTLASTGDDTAIRTWFADRDIREGIMKGDDEH